MSKKQTRRKKEISKVTAYRQMLKDSPDPGNTYDNHIFSGLQRSDELCDDNSTEGVNEPIAKGKWRYAVMDYIKEKAVEFIVVTVAFGFISWSGLSIISIQRDNAVVEERLNSLLEQVHTINSDFATKEILELQVAAIKQEVDLKGRIDMRELEYRIDLIEKQITIINNT